MLVFLKAPFLDLLFFLIYINNLLYELTCNIVIFADLMMIILFISKRNWNFNLWQQPELVFELESYLQYTAEELV